MNEVERFAKELAEIITNEETGYSAIYKKVHKNNKDVPAVVLTRGENIVSVVVYAETFYMEHVEDDTLSLRDVAKKIINFVDENAAFTEDDAKSFAEEMLNKENFLNNVIITIQNSEVNKENLARCPHRKALDDISIVYRYVKKDEKVVKAENGQRSVLVENSLLESFDLTEEELFPIALENTMRLYPASIMDIGEIMMSVITGIECDNEDYIPSDSSMIIISNKSKLNGAAAILYPGLLKELAEHVNSDLILLPSSIHEFICVPTETVDEEANSFSNMVDDVNNGCVDVADRLSNSAYIYHRADDVISLYGKSDKPLV